MTSIPDPARAELDGAQPDDREPDDREPDDLKPDNVEPDLADLGEAELFDPPWSITTAVRLMWVGAALTVLVPAIGFVSIGSIKDNIATQLRAQHQYSTGEVDAVYRNLIISSAIMALAAAVVWMLMARANRAGKRWARTISTGFGVINVLAFGVALNQGQNSVLQLVLDALSVALAATILVLLWLPDSSDYYYFRGSRRSTQ